MKKAIITYENLSVSSGYQSYSQYLTSTSTLYYSEKTHPYSPFHHLFMLMLKI